MKNLMLALGLFLLVCAMSPVLLAAERDQSGDALGRALKGKAAESGSSGTPRASSRNNSCAEYGAGFIRIEGSSTCIRAGGNVRIDAGVQR